MPLTALPRNRPVSRCIRARYWRVCRDSSRKTNTSLHTDGKNGGQSICRARSAAYVTNIPRRHFPRTQSARGSPSGKRVLTTFHDLFVLTANYSSREFRERFAEQARRAAANSDLIIAVSQFTASQMDGPVWAFRPLAFVLFHMVPVGPHFRAVERIRRSFCASEQCRRGRNRSDLVAAFEAVPAPWRLVLAGASTDMGQSDIQEQIRTSSAASRITVLDISQSRLAEMYRRRTCSLFLHWTRASACRSLKQWRMVFRYLTSNGSALKEIAQGAALLVNPTRCGRNRGRTVQATYVRSATPGKAESSCRARSLQYTWERAVQRTYAVYRELAS